ncbi:MAG: ABC transporter permease subunit [Oscillospiraceae bacterium]|jgi:NitT/TauT family transport system permease protein|nr:ABC transporter permease subunit [Oscillospiraceae bacterium]
MTQTIKKHGGKILAVLFWLVVWHVAAVVVDNAFVLVTPFAAFKRLAELMTEIDFLRSVLRSLLRITAGMLLALTVGVALAAAAFAWNKVAVLLSPFMSAVKSVPVASFTILALFWLGSSKLSTFTAFLIALPVVYTNVLGGLQSTDKATLEMAAVYKIAPLRRALHIYLPSAAPFFLSACSLSIGMCWKAGVAAEVIGQPKGTLGEWLYYAKIYFSAADLFAVTAAVVAVSFAFEKAFMWALSRAYSRLT